MKEPLEEILIILSKNKYGGWMQQSMSLMEIITLSKARLSLQLEHKHDEKNYGRIIHDVIKS